MQLRGSEDIPRLTGKRLERFLAEKRIELAQISSELDPIADCLCDFLSGGKRLRATLLFMGWRCAGGPDCDGVIAAAAAMELVQAGALIHDDVIDESDFRRGKPAVHQRFSGLHADSDWHGSAHRFGNASAVLIGNLCLAWAGELLGECDLPAAAVAQAKSYFAIMLTELMAGQYLDVLEQAKGSDDVAAALRVAETKTAKYTFERPLQIGAALAGGSDDLMEALSRFALPLGRAFQMRDDLLGVFGDPGKTGKPAGDDLREGKRTVLVALALASMSPEDARFLDASLGNRDLDSAMIDDLQRIIESSGARQQVEQLISRDTREAIAALDDGGFAAGPRRALEDIARALSARSA
ncbi:MAG: polyprenyl synthetase family protein [Candidatus Nanopelagicales bacterium]|nr:polyprenyl synthetase family protein [Candidatus Nanopelagicales bacterium]